MSRKYSKPPIIEAICEFRFQQDSPWDLAMPGLIFGKLGKDFPKRKQVKEMSLELSSDPDGTPHMLEVGRLQFFREDEKALVQVGPNKIAVNRLKPYASWDEFEPMIRLGFQAYQEVAGPTGIHRVHLRYINRIEVRAEREDLKEFFAFRPFVGEKLPQDYGAFIVGIKIPQRESQDTLKIEFTSAGSDDPGVLATLLDLDYFLAAPGTVKFDGVFDWIGEAHDRIETTFEACITDRLRAEFEEVKD